MVFQSAKTKSDRMLSALLEQSLFLCEIDSISHKSACYSREDQLSNDGPAGHLEQSWRLIGRFDSLRRRYVGDDASQPGFFDLSDRYDAQSAAGDPLERLAAVVDFEVFRGPLVAALRRSVRGKGGRPPFDPVLIFMVLVLQALYSLSDEATEFPIEDRLSFQRFLGLGLDGTGQDGTTVWLFRERLVNAKATDTLVARFDAALKDRGYLSMGGQIIDATVVPAPKQHNTQTEKAATKEGRVPEDRKPAKTRQKDRDARWSIKYSKAKVSEGADPKAAKPVDLAIPMFG